MSQINYELFFPLAQHTHTPSLAEFDTIVPPVFSFLQLTGCVDCRLDFIANFAALGAGCLDGSDDLFGFIVGDFTEDDVFAIKPVGYDGGDEELRAVSIIIDFPHQHKHFSPRINTDHGNELKGDEGRRGSWKEDREGRSGRRKRDGKGLTCLVQHWPWREEMASGASARSSRLRISRHRSTCHRCPFDSEKRQKSVLC